MTYATALQMNLHIDRLLKGHDAVMYLPIGCVSYSGESKKKVIMSLRKKRRFCRKLAIVLESVGLERPKMVQISFKGRQFSQDMILQSVRCYPTYALSYRNIEKLMKKRSFSVDHSTINRWVVHYSLQLAQVFRQKNKRTGDRWRMDETYIKVKGQ